MKRWRVSPIALLAALLPLALAACSPTEKAEETAASVEHSEQQSQPLPRFVDLGSDACVACKKMAPIIEALREEYRGRVDVVFIDARKDPDAGKPYGLRLIPTQVFLDAEGNEVFRHEGFFSREAIEQVFAEHFGIEVERRMTGMEQM